MKSEKLCSQYLFIIEQLLSVFEHYRADEEEIVPFKSLIYNIVKQNGISFVIFA